MPALNGPGPPATAGALDAALHLIGCCPATTGVPANWTGQGPLSRRVLNEHFKSGRYRLLIHNNGTFREATAAGTVAGLTLSARQSADLGNAHSGPITICVGSSCQPPSAAGRGRARS